MDVFFLSYTRFYRPLLLLMHHNKESTEKILILLKNFRKWKTLISNIFNIVLKKNKLSQILGDKKFHLKKILFQQCQA